MYACFLPPQMSASASHRCMLLHCITPGTLLRSDGHFGTNRCCVFSVCESVTLLAWQHACIAVPCTHVCSSYSCCSTLCFNQDMLQCVGQCWSEFCQLWTTNCIWHAPLLASNSLGLFAALLRASPAACGPFLGRNTCQCMMSLGE